MQEQMLLGDYSPSGNENYKYGFSNESTFNQTPAGSMAYQANINPTATFGRGYTQDTYGMADSTPSYTPNYPPPVSYAPALSGYEEPPTADQEEINEARRRR
jgi:hypothetical protein